jgi:hypothetical protein
MNGGGSHPADDLPGSMLDAGDSPQTSAATVGAKGNDGREETSLERVDRNMEELNGELRVVVTGVQVLFAFLLVVPFDTGFAHVGP